MVAFVRVTGSVRAVVKIGVAVVSGFFFWKKDDEKMSFFDINKMIFSCGGRKQKISKWEKKFQESGSERKRIKNSRKSIFEEKI